MASREQTATEGGEAALKRKLGICGCLLAASVMAAVAQMPPAVEAVPAKAPVIYVDHGPNALLQQQKHYVVLVSLDGFRYDYAKRDGASNLLAMAAHGASAPEGMLPSYPSVTFPNHYTIVTGLYPEHHGIVAMHFYNEDHTKRYDYNKDAALDGSWYGGAPLWVLAEQQGMRTACFFWPGSGAAIDGVRPSYYLNFQDKYPNDPRVDQVLDWLRLPADQRPHFITLYYSDVDHAGHGYGPDSPQVHEAVQNVDREIGRLRAGIAALHLPVDLIVVSDHGMIAEKGPWIDLDKYADLSKFTTVGPLMYANDDADAATAYEKLKSADEHFAVYRRTDMPKGLHYDSNAREGDPVIVPLGPYAIRARGPEAGKKDYQPDVGVHGLDPRQFPEMKAIFYAEGPDVKQGVALKPFENVNIFPFVSEILGLDHPPVDGSVNVLEPALKKAQ